jgi:hypothetical protein
MQNVAMQSPMDKFSEFLQKQGCNVAFEELQETITAQHPNGMQLTCNYIPRQIAWKMTDMPDDDDDRFVVNVTNFSDKDPADSFLANLFNRDKLEVDFSVDSEINWGFQFRIMQEKYNQKHSSQEGTMLDAALQAA